MWALPCFLPSPSRQWGLLWGAPVRGRSREVRMSRTCAVGKMGLSEGSPPRRAKSNGQRFPREVPFAGRRRRLADESGAYSRRVFNFWALPRAHGRYGRTERRKKCSSEGLRPPGCGAATRAHRREVPKSCNPVHPRWQSQRFLSGGAGCACGTGRAGCRRSKGIPIRLRGCGPLPPARDTAW